MLMRGTILILLSFSIVIGCTPNIQDYDAEKLEYDQVTKLKKAQSDPFNSPQTAPIVKVADDPDAGIYVEVIKLKPVIDGHGIKLDVWTVKATNKKPDPKCVSIMWKLQDFEFESEQPLEFLIRGGETLNLGKMKQSIWSFDGATIAIPPSGYVDKMNVRKADVDKITHRLTCDMLEEDIDDLKTDTNAPEF